jgi:hypothetical protein
MLIQPKRLAVRGSSLLLFFLAACSGQEASLTTPTLQAAEITATAASAIIMQALGTPISGSEPMAVAAQAVPPVLALAATLTPAAPAPDATALAATVDAEVMAQVNATLTASALVTVAPTDGVAATATPVPQPTVDGTALAAQVATQVAREMENNQATMAAAPPLQPATSTPTHIPTRRPTATWTPSPAPRVRTAPVSMQDTASIWSYTTFQDLSSPGTHTYYVDVAPLERLRWAFEWCATSELLLDDILTPLVLEFSIDGMNVAAEKLTRGAKNYAGWRCRTWATEVSGWHRGETVTLEIHYRLLDAIYDGKDSYPAGDYYQVIYATAR